MLLKGSGLGASGRRHDLVLTEPVLTVQMVLVGATCWPGQRWMQSDSDAPTRVRVQQALREDRDSTARALEHRRQEGQCRKGSV